MSLDRSDSCTGAPLPEEAGWAAVPVEREVPPVLGCVRSARAGSEVLLIFIATPYGKQTHLKFNSAPQT